MCRCYWLGSLCHYVMEMFYDSDNLHKHVNLWVYVSMPLYFVHLLIILYLSLQHRPSVCNVECTLFNHFTNNAVLNEHQYGFRSAVSTENASCVLLNEILTAMNCKQMVGGIFVISTKYLTVLITLSY
jgi:hypothetical protein